uniref:ORF2 n=1 Tax=Torque teno virus TaxID=68887 RepID=Q8V7C9_9VIRU|nr:ORF2 [Torque teno virus]
MPWRPSLHNIPGREAQWFSSIWGSHDCFCGCGDPIGHINSLNNRFRDGGAPRPPPGLDQPNPDPQQGPERPLRPLPALPAPADPDPAPRRGGGADGGGAAGAAAAGDHGGCDEGDLEDLFAAAAEDDM